MRSCIRIPRIYLPRKSFKRWATPACETLSDRGELERVAREVADAPSAFFLTLPRAVWEDEAEDRASEIKESMYDALEGGFLRRLDRGMTFLTRTRETGRKHGILAAVDLEEYAGEGTLLRGNPLRSEEAEPLLKLRRNAVMEFPAVVLLFRDKKNKLFRGLEDEEFEKLYDFDLMRSGGKISGSFLPDYFAADVAQELMNRADPCFVVAAGNAELTAARLYWEEIKTGISVEERRNHPARFLLAEFRNAYEEKPRALCRFVSETDSEALADYLSRSFKCERRGQLLFPVKGDAVSVAKADACLSTYLRANGGRVEYCTEDRIPGKEGIGIVFRETDVDDLFNALKGGKSLPPHVFTVDKRYHLEGREISYD